MTKTQLCTRPSTIIEGVRSTLAASGEDSSEASAIGIMRTISKMSKKKRAIAEIVIGDEPRSRLECIQCALAYIKKDNNEETATMVMGDMDNHEFTPEGKDGLPTGYGRVGLENMIGFMGYAKHDAFLECYEVAIDYWIRHS